MTSLLLRGGRVVDPANGVDRIADVRIVDGFVAELGANLANGNADEAYDVAGCLVTPGLIDAHVHFRDPGFTYKEDLQTGAKSALAGGFVRVCCMPNTNPALDSATRIADIVERGRQSGIHIHPIGAITAGRLLKNLAPLADMAEAGAIGYSDDGESTRNETAMLDALRLSSSLNKPIMVHCEDPALASGGVMNEGDVSRALGVQGIPAAAEEDYIARDIRLAADSGGWLHVLHVSTVRGATLIRDARARGINVTAEVMPHHLLLTDGWVAGRRRFAGETGATHDLDRPDPNAIVNPPLRPESDALGLVEFLRDGTFDFIATDHAPHAKQDKPDDISQAASGMLGLEVAIPSLAEIVRRGDLTWDVIIRNLTINVASTLNLPGGTLSPGTAADITVIDPERLWTVTEDEIRSRSKNTPLLGIEVQGRAVMTLVGGEILHNVHT